MTNHSYFGDWSGSEPFVEELLGIFNRDSLYATDSRNMREEWRDALTELGWVPEVRLGQSNLRLGYKKVDTGLCIQLGNVCRFHSDLLKLGWMSRNSGLTRGVIVVPSDEFSRRLGSNHASFSKAERDVEMFLQVVSLPILIIEVDGG